MVTAQRVGAAVARPLASPTEDARGRVGRARLFGPSASVDPRRDLARSDLTELRLASRVVAGRYAEPVGHRMIRSRVTIHAGADRRRAVSELLFGEEFAVLDVADGVAWGRSIRDDYVGYVSADSLRPSAAMSPPTHRLAADALVYAEPDMKSRVTDALPLNAVVHATRVDPAWHRVGRGLIHDRALARLDRVGGDLLAVAMRFLGSPYRWGGRTRAGVDCSGLVQAAAYAVGLSCARDTDQQRETTGDAVDPDAARRTGDIVYFPGHVGIMADGDRLLHATAFWMTTLIEPLADVVARARASNPRPILAVRRLNACLQPSGDL